MNIFKIFNRKASTKKYELIPSDKPGFYRVKALRDFGLVKKGDIGGYVAGEHNLWHDDNSWVGDNAQVYDNAWVYGNAWVGDNAQVYDNAWVGGDAWVGGNARVSSIRDYIVFKNWWSSGRHITWTRSNDMWRVGCFYGTDRQLIEKAYKDSQESGREYERIVKYVEEINTASRQDDSDELTRLRNMEEAIRKYPDLRRAVQAALKGGYECDKKIDSALMAHHGLVSGTPRPSHSAEEPHPVQPSPACTGHCQT